MTPGRPHHEHSNPERVETKFVVVGFRGEQQRTHAKGVRGTVVEWVEGAISCTRMFARVALDDGTTDVICSDALRVIEGKSAP